MEKVWLHSYQEGVPAEIDPHSFSSLADLFYQTCEHFRDRPAFMNLGTRLSYAELYEHARNFAACMQQNLQLKKGDRIALMMPNCLQYPVALFGSLLAGLTVVNVNPLYTADELIHQLNDAGAETLVVLANFAHTVERALPETTLKQVIVTQLGDLFSFPKSWIVNSVVKYVKRLVPQWEIPHHMTFTEALHTGKAAIFQPVLLGADDVAFLQYTGGTTGVAKGAMLTHGNLLANITQASAWIESLLTPGQEIIVTALPLYHIFSLTANCLTFFRWGALNVLIANPRDLDAFVKEIKNTRFTAITGVNTLFNALLHHPKFSEVDFSHLKLALGGGMAVQQAVAKEWERVTQSPLLEAYGLTETSPAVTS